MNYNAVWELKSLIQKYKQVNYNDGYSHHYEFLVANGLKLSESVMSQIVSDDTIYKVVSSGQLCGPEYSRTEDDVKVILVDGKENPMDSLSSLPVQKCTVVALWSGHIVCTHRDYTIISEGNPYWFNQWGKKYIWQIINFKWLDPTKVKILFKRHIF